MTDSRILIVEDDPGISAPLATFVDGKGFNTRVATDVKSAEDVLAQHEADLILLDVMLPGESGGEPDNLRLDCRPAAIKRALSNLIDNAIHFARSTIVTASIQGKTLLIEVADDGQGVPPERPPDIIEPFVRLDCNRNDCPGSMGL